jgi:hypothetical protein
MGHEVKYEIELSDEEVYKKIIDVLTDNGFEINDSWFAKGEYSYINFNINHSYSFELNKWLEEQGVKGSYLIKIWYEEREPDDIITVGDY